MVDTLALGASVARRVGSSPTLGTKLEYEKTKKHPIGTGGNLIYKRKIEIMFIYTLSSSSEPDNIRYVGKANNLKDRLRRHIGKYYLNLEINYKNNWIKSELSKGNKILINELELVDESNWIEREKYWIEQLKQWGFKLVNTTIGGEGILLTKEIIKKRSETKIQNNSETKKEIIEKYQIQNKENIWFAVRICPICKESIKYESNKKSSLFANLRRAEREQRSCNSCKSKGIKNYFYGKKLNDGKIKQERYGTKILQFDLDNNLINEFNSIREASEKTGIDRKSISNCSKGIKSYNTTGGYKFKRKENI